MEPFVSDFCFFQKKDMVNLKYEVVNMTDLVEFLTSKEIIIVYIIATLACLVCFIIYLIERNNEKLKRKHNTKELNRLVEEIKEMLPEEEQEDSISYEEPVLEQIEEQETTMVEEMLPKVEEMEEEVEMVMPLEEKPVVKETIQDLEMTLSETKIEEPKFAYHKVEEQELEYTTIEPDEQTAKLELKRIAEELEKEEKQEIQEENIELTSYEEEQEKTAIISMEELLKKSREMYAANELTQYKDEGNEPISLQDLERQREALFTPMENSFDITSVVGEKEEIEEVFTKEEKQEISPVENVVIEEKREVPQRFVMNDFYCVKKEEQTEEKKFKSSPIISPIYGIERDASKETEIALENTANYEKLDEQLRRSNEFVMSMKELQQKLD